MAKTPKVEPLTSIAKRQQTIRYCENNPRWRYLQSRYKRVHAEKDKLAERQQALADDIWQICGELMQIEWAADLVLRKTDYKLPRKKKT